MKRTLLLLVFLFFTIVGISQINYEKGYYVNNENEKIDCLIKNEDWKNVPKYFLCKQNKESEVERIKADNIKVLVIDGGAKYEVFNVKIDRSIERAKDYTNDKYPEFKKERLLLKVLVEGKANLYQYVDGAVVKYFFSTDSVKTQQLVFKSYIMNDGVTVGKNEQFKQQLFNHVNCLSRKFPNTLGYNEKDLTKYFVGNNECLGDHTSRVEKKEKRDWFNLRAKAGVNFSKLEINNSLSNARDVNFDNEVNFRLGIETEYVLPFNKNKWSVVIEPTYQSYSSEKEIVYAQSVGLYEKVEVDYKSIELPIGVRYRMFLGDKTNHSLFINAFYLIDFSLSSEITYERFNSLEIESNTPFVFGFGGEFLDKVNMEVRYYTNKNLLKKYGFWDSNHSTIAFIVGYKLF